jgi:pseudaminic acid synthase
MSEACHEFAIAGRRIGAGHPCYLIAELSANHHQDLQRALHLIDLAAEAGADAVKIQTYTADTLTLDCDQAPFRIEGGTLWDGRTLHSLYAEAMTPWEWTPALMQRATEQGMALFSSPFDATAVDFLESCQVPAYKIASFELVDIPLIEKVAATGKPLILSTGMGSREEIETAVVAARAAGSRELSLLKCTSSYPAPADEANLRRMMAMAETFGVVPGLSDHTLETVVPVTAVALGASIIEKHFTESRDHPGPDSAFSLEPHEFKEMVRQVRMAEAAMGDGTYGLTAKEAGSRMFRRSLFVTETIRAGEVFTEANVRSIRPAGGLPPSRLKAILGKRARLNLSRGTPLQQAHVDFEDASPA